MKYIITSAGKIFKNGTELNPYIREDKGTYVIRINGKRYGLAKLVAKNFVPNPFNYRNVIFKDKNRLNCDASNLDWVSNVEYSLYCGFFTPKIIGTQEDAIKKTKCELLKLFYKTGERKYLIQSWEMACKKITIWNFIELQGYVWEYFEDRAMRYSLYDPVYLIILYSKSVKKKSEKKIFYSINIVPAHDIS